MMSALTVKDGSTKKKLKEVKYFVSKEPLLQRKPTCLFASHESLRIYSHPMKGTRCALLDGILLHPVCNPAAAAGTQNQTGSIQ